MIRYPELSQAFQEMESGLTPQEAVAEASRCIKCQDAPCSSGCPSGVDVAKFIRQLASRNFSGAAKVIKEANILPGTCARICPQDILCEGRCRSTELVRPIRIGLLQRFVADQEAIKGPRDLKCLAPKGIRTAVVGAGPAGLSAATFLKRLGYDVDVFESRPLPGGFLVWGIPAYRLPKRVILSEIEFIKKMGVNFILGRKVQDPVSFLNDYRAVFIAAGCNHPFSLEIPGEELEGVIQALDLLHRVGSALLEERDLDMDPLGRVVVIGGGNAAIDAAVTAQKLGADQVTILYRRTENEMPSWEVERRLALEQGVNIRTLVVPKAFHGQNGRLREIECLAATLGDPDESGRRRPVPVEGSEFRIECSTAVSAIGQGPEKAFNGLETDASGRVMVKNHTLATSVSGIFAGGDLIRGSDTAVRAVGDGKKAAFSMDAWIQGNI